MRALRTEKQNIQDKNTFCAGGDFSYHFREVPEDLGKRFRVEFFFMAPSQDTRASVLAYYDERGDATWVICNREVRKRS